MIEGRPAAGVSSFTIFRRPLAASERPGLADAIDGLVKEYELASYYPSDIRRLVSFADGRSVYVAPAIARPRPVPAAECLPPRVRARRAELIAQQQRRKTETVYCLVEVSSKPTPASGCEPFAANEEAVRLFEASDYFRQPVVELVPDGVHSERISYLGRQPLVVPVKNNAVSFRPPRPAQTAVVSELRRLERHIGHFGHLESAADRRWEQLLDETDPTRIEWLDDGGNVIRTIGRPTLAGTRATSVGDVRAPVTGG